MVSAALRVQLHAGVPDESGDQLDKELERLALNEQHARQEEERQAQERQRRKAERERQRRREAKAGPQRDLEELLVEHFGIGASVEDGGAAVGWDVELNSEITQKCERCLVGRRRSVTA